MGYYLVIVLGRVQLSAEGPVTAMAFIVAGQFGRLLDLSHFFLCPLRLALAEPIHLLLFSSAIEHVVHTYR